MRQRESYKIGMGMARRGKTENSITTHRKQARMKAFPLCLCVLSSVLLSALECGAFVGQREYWPNDTATVVLKMFCTVNYCPPTTPETTWEEVIQGAVEEWNAAESNFTFTTRAPRPDDDPCSPPEGTVIISLTDEHACGDTFLSYAGRANLYRQRGRTVRARIHFDTYYLHDSWNRNGWAGVIAFPLMLHELGHIVGLDHPNESGQAVDAIMNVPVEGYSLTDDDITGIRHLYGVRPAMKDFTGYLENPSDGSPVSGIGVISGWVCDAEGVSVTVADELPDGRGGTYFDGRIYEDAAYGTRRKDTKEICGDTNNGFGLLINWNLMPAGEYTVLVYVDGKELGRAVITVTRLGTEFLRGASQKKYVLEDFPEEGSSVTVEWQQSLQNFVITEFGR